MLITMLMRSRALWNIYLRCVDRKGHALLAMFLLTAETVNRLRVVERDSEGLRVHARALVGLAAGEARAHAWAAEAAGLDIVVRVDLKGDRVALGGLDFAGVEFQVWADSDVEVGGVRDGAQKRG